MFESDQNLFFFCSNVKGSVLKTCRPIICLFLFFRLSLDLFFFALRSFPCSCFVCFDLFLQFFVFNLASCIFLWFFYSNIDSVQMILVDVFVGLATYF